MDQRDKLIRDRELDDLRAVLDLPHGRRLLWRLMGEAGLFSTVWDPSSKIHYKAGQQDFGRYILLEVVAARPDAYPQMISESQIGDLKNV
jgi:hypothetical protein